MKNQHPASWQRLPLAELGMGRTQSVNPSEHPTIAFEVWSVPSFPTGLPERLLGKDIGSSKQRVQCGDVLLCKINPRINRVWVVGQKRENEQIASTEWIVFRSEHLVPQYLAYAFRESSFRQRLTANVSGVGGSLTRARPTDVADLEIPIAPANEQHRIVAKLDALFEKSHSIRETLDRLPRLLANLQKSILNSAFRGDLTKEWRENSGSSSGACELATAIRHSHVDAGGHKKGNAADPTEGVHNLDKAELPDTWEILELREVCQPNRPICYGILKPGPQQDDGVPYIRVADFPGDQLQVSSIKKTSPAIDAQFARSRLLAGDLLMSIRGTVGRMCFIPPELEGANITQDSARLSIHQLVNPEYVRLFLKSPTAQVRMAQATKGVAIRGINIGDVRAIQIPLPEPAEQDEIVRQLSEMLSRIKALQEVCYNAGLRLKSFESSALAKAFRGELVPQDPNDEPAAVLLERIRAQKPAAGTKRGRGGKADARLES